MIHILTPDVYNRIAAGEVVDRPYSVVKELTENAIDAGATEIEIEIEGGGKKRVRVTDNGCGIEKSDLKNAFLPHATSKLQSAEDLMSIATLGFRGEAIASIASVSKTEIVSKTAEGEAWSLQSDGGKMGEIVPAAGANGTCVTVDELFFNTPARLKFLKSDISEEGDVTNMVARFILSRPEISFTYLVNGKVRYRSFGDGLKSAIAAVYGAGVLERCIEINADKHGIVLRGFLGDRNFSKPNRSYQSLFVNGRYVVNQTVSLAVANAYKNYLMTRQYPFYVLFLDLPSEIVDVNVHPNKADVRFANNRIVYGCVYSVVSAVLDGSSGALEYTVGSAFPAEVRSTFPNPCPPAEEAQKAENEGTAPGNAFRNAPQKAPAMSYAEAKKELQFDVSPIAKPSVIPYREPQPAVLEVRAPQPQETDYFEENRRTLLERGKAKQDKIDPASLEFKGELFRTYLIYESGDEAYLVDQHAAHERILYDRLREKCENRAPVSQPMLLPFILHTNGQEFAFLLKNLDILRSFGFEIEDFGGDSFKVSAVPADLYGMDLEDFFAEALSSMDTLRAIKLPDLLKDRLASMACKAAVKGGEKLTDGEVRELLKEMEGDMGIKCPHGRPACVKVRKSELEKLFKRIV